MRDLQSCAAMPRVGRLSGYLEFETDPIWVMFMGLDGPVSARWTVNAVDNTSEPRRRRTRRNPLQTAVVVWAPYLLVDATNDSVSQIEIQIVELVADIFKSTQEAEGKPASPCLRARKRARA